MMGTTIYSVIQYSISLMAVGTGFLSSSLLNWSRPCGMGLGVTVGSSYTQKTGCKDSSHPSPTLQCSAPEGPRASYKFSPKLSQGWDKTQGIYSMQSLSSASRIIYIRTFFLGTRHLVELFRDYLKLFSL